MVRNPGSAIHTLLAALLAACLAGASNPSPASAQGGPIGGVHIQACPRGLGVVVILNSLGASAPRVDVVLPDGGFQADWVGAEQNPAVNGGQAIDFIYWNDRDLAPGTKGVIVVHEPNGYFSPKFTVEADCPPLGSVRGIAFEDLDRDGKRDIGEPAIHTASWKLTGGGSWFVCGHVGGDTTYGPTVKPGTYLIVPVAQPGWRATTAVRQAVVKSLGYAAVNNDIGFVRDPASRGDVCGQYAPAIAPPPGGAPSAGLPPTQPTAPPPAVSDQTIPGALRRYTLFSVLLQAAETAGVLDSLAGTQGVTLFAPTDDAFARMGTGTLTALLNDPRRLEQALKSHIVAAKVAAPSPGDTAAYKTVNGRSVQISNDGGVLSVAAGGVRANASHAILTGDGNAIYPVDQVLFTR